MKRNDEISRKILNKQGKLCWGDPVFKNFIGTNPYTFSLKGNEVKCIANFKYERTNKAVTGVKLS